MAARPKNVLLLWADQQRADTVGPDKDSRLRMPHLERLAAPGSHDVRRDLYARLLRWQRETQGYAHLAGNLIWRTPPLYRSAMERLDSRRGKGRGGGER